MSPSHVARLRRALFISSAAALLWSVGVALTGGFYVRILGWRVSSRDYRDALGIGLLMALTAVALTWRVGGWQTLRAEWSWIGRGVTALGAVAPRRRTPRWLPVVPAAAIALAGIARAVSQWANGPPLWFDEEAILLNVRDRSWSDLGGSLWLGQSAPFGWLVVQRAALMALGSGELAVRLVPLLFGIGTIVVALWIGLRWMGAIASAVLVLLFTFGLSVAHYTFEAKHYSADTFWAALLPALAVWATEGDGVATRARRYLLWWIAAACGQMLANGAVLVAPGCALFLAVLAFRRDGRRAAVMFLVSGLIWLAAFGLHYEIALRATQDSEYLRNYWSNEFPSASMGLVDRVRWVGARFEALGRDPGSTAWWKTLWIFAALGLALGGRSALGLAFATAPLSAFVLAGAGIVPLYQRFVLWIVPALYVGLALTIDRAARLVRDALRRRRRAATAVAALVLVVAGVVCLDIYTRGKRHIDGRAADSNHHLDDRGAVRWLMTRLRPGDAILTTRLAWGAVWWYGRISIANADPDGVVRHPDGVALLEFDGSGPPCPDDRSWEDLRRHRRLLVYVGFDAPTDFEMLRTLDTLGVVEEVSEFSALGRVAVVDLEEPAAGERIRHDVSLETCVRLRPARRW